VTRIQWRRGPALAGLTAACILVHAADAHLASHVLDVAPIPVSAPDERHVQDAHRSGLPIRVRLFIEDDGKVSDGIVLAAAPGDEQAAQSVLEMFRETAFIPGRLDGRDVASFIDIELTLDLTLPEVIPVTR
jgi:hypothetical protein